MTTHFQVRLDFANDDLPEQKLNKLNQWIEASGLSIETLVLPLATLLSIPIESGYTPPECSPQELKGRIHRALIEICDAFMQQRPMIMVIENAHWMDPSTRDFVGQWIEHVRTKNVLLIVTFRPEFEPPWPRHDYVTQLSLNRLSRKQTASMVTRVAGNKRLPEEVVSDIIAKTDGVPLFVEELTKFLLEGDGLEEQKDRFVLSKALGTDEIPSSLQDSLMARLDRLAPVREVAQLAATIGRTSDFKLLTAVSGLAEEDLTEALTGLEKAEILYRSGVPPETQYFFKHALIRDAAYQSLLKSQRRKFHHQIADALEQQFEGRADNEPEVMAYHFTEARMPERAIKYWHRGGQLAIERSAAQEAVAHLQTGLKLSEDLALPPELKRQQLALTLDLGSALVFAQGQAHKNVEKTFKKALQLSGETGTPKQLFLATWNLWGVFIFQSRFLESYNLAKQLLKVAPKTDSGLLLQAYHSGWTSAWHQGELREALSYTENGCKLYDPVQHRHHKFIYGGHDPGLCAWMVQSHMLLHLGYPDQSSEAIDRAETLARELEHPLSLAVFLMYGRGFNCIWRRDPDLAHRYACELAEMATEYGSNELGHEELVLRIWAEYQQGQSSSSPDEMSKAIQRIKESGWSVSRPILTLLLAQTLAKQGQTKPSLKVADEAIKILNEGDGTKSWIPMFHLVKGELLENQPTPEIETAEACYNEAFQQASLQESRLFQLPSATGIARLWQKQGKPEDAKKLLAPIVESYTEGFEMREMKEAKELLASL